MDRRTAHLKTLRVLKRKASEWEEQADRLSRKALERREDADALREMAEALAQATE